MQLIQTGQDRIATSASMQGFTVQGPSSATRNDGMAIWYDPSNTSDVTPRFRLGSWWMDENTGNSYKYVKSDVALNMGQLVAQAAPTIDTVASTNAALDYITLTTGGLTHNAEVGNYLWCIGAAAGGTTGAANLSVQILRQIKANNSDTDSPAKAVYVALKSVQGGSTYDADLLHAAPTNTTTCSIIRPWHCIVSTATTVPVGVAIGPVAANGYTMIQKSGLALVLAIGNGTALAVNQLAAPGAGGTILGSAANSIYMGAASIVPMALWAGAASTLLPCEVNFIGV
jgi:hypothetical protein